MQEIIVFGTGYYANSKWNDIIKEYQVVAVLDNKIKKAEMQLFNQIRVYNPQYYENINKYPILIMMREYVSVVNQLKKMGVDSENIWIINSDIESKGIKYKISADIDKVIALPDFAIDEDWGYRRGTPIGRVYIDKFLEKYKQHIRGDIMEVAETTYSERFSVKEDTSSYTAIHIDGADGCRRANLETAEGLIEDEFDTMIITQTLAYIYDLKAVVKNIYKSLKKNGYCMITVTDIGHMGCLEADLYGSYWGFHSDGIKRLFIETFGEGNVTVEKYGNIKTVAAQLYGLAAEDIEKECLEWNDARYPMIIGVVAHKVG